MMDDIKPIFDFKDKSNLSPLLICGPCSAESENQVMTIAESLAECGIKVFRAGLWKPRTKPGSFEGIGDRGLKWLEKVKTQFGLRVLTEVATRAHLHACLDHAIDGVWIGARTTTNPFAVQEIADELAANHITDEIAVLVKNPVNPDIDLWVGAIERIYNAGTRRIGAVHRGFSTYGKHEYRNPPHWSIPIDLRRRIPQLTLLCDPSHIGGKSEYVAPLSREAMDMNFDGLMVECHCQPAQALSDARQQITPGQLREIIRNLNRAETDGKSERLATLRQEIDKLDDSLLALISKRMAVAREIGKYKKANKLSVVQPDRYTSLIEDRRAAAEALGLSPSFVEKLLSVIHEESVAQQIKQKPTPT